MRAYNVDVGFGAISALSLSRTLPGSSWLLQVEKDMSTYFIIIFAVLFGFMILSQILIRSRAKALEGKPLPAMPGQLGKALASEESALLYFMSPQCGACRPWTARFSEMSKRNAHVHVINVAQELEIARALGVMATPSTLVVKDGRIQSYHVGGVPSDVIAQFA